LKYNLDKDWWIKDEVLNVKVSLKM